MSTLIDELIPTITAGLEARKDELLAEAGGRVTQLAARVAWPHLLTLLSHGLRIGYMAVLQRFSTLTIGDLLTRITEDLKTLKHELPQ